MHTYLNAARSRTIYQGAVVRTPFFSIRGRFDQTSFFMRGVIVPPSKLKVTNNYPAQFTRAPWFGRRATTTSTRTELEATIIAFIFSKVCSTL